ncbi:MAG: SEC-C domain-containing protein [Bacteroidetes bacterium]|nr:SEC-C domain-containing protein [Bacteroidota bacterium]
MNTCPCGSPRKWSNCARWAS